MFLSYMRTFQTRHEMYHLCKQEFVRCYRHFNDEIVMNLTILKPGQSMNTILASLGRGCIRGSSRHVKFLTLFLKAYFICLVYFYFFYCLFKNKFV